MGPTPQPPLIHDQNTRKEFALAGLLCVTTPLLVIPLLLSAAERSRLPAGVITALYAALLPLIPGIQFAGIVLSVKGLKQAGRQNGKGQFQAVIGMIVGSYLLLEVFVLVFFTAWEMGVIPK